MDIPTASHNPQSQEQKNHDDEVWQVEKLALSSHSLHTLFQKHLKKKKKIQVNKFHLNLS